MFTVYYIVKNEVYSFINCNTCLISLNPIYNVWGNTIPGILYIETPII